MAWTTPRTWVTAEIVTASLMNTHVRDNLNETAPAKATVTGGIMISEGSNSISARKFDQNTVATAESTSSTSYTDLATSGPAVTVTTGTRALVILTASVRNDTLTAQNRMSYAISGATTQSATDNISYLYTTPVASNAYRHRASLVHLDVGLTGGSNTFTAKYKVDSGTGTWSDRRIHVLGL